MFSIIKTELPEYALLQRYRENGSYTDCYLSRLSREVSFSEYIQGRTRSWFMSETLECGAARETRLYFGSAVVPIERQSSGRTVFGFGFQALVGFHKLYSVALLSAATSALRSQGSGDGAA